MSRQGRTPPPERVAGALQRVQKDWERRRAYEDCLAAEQSLELAGLDYEARQIRKIRCYSLTPDA